MPEHPAVDARRILWAGPLTVCAAVVAVLIVRMAAVAVLELPEEGFQPLGWFFPVFDTVVLVTAAVIVFAALALSMIPDLLMHSRRPQLFTWPRTSVLMAMHVVAWWVTVTLLTRLTCSKRAD